VTKRVPLAKLTASHRYSVPQVACESHKSITNNIEYAVRAEPALIKSYFGEIVDDDMRIRCAA